MCGRIVQVTPITKLAQLVGLNANVGTLNPSYNVTPGRAIPNFSMRLGSPGFETYTWGLVPHWAKDQSRKHINATAERIVDSPAFRDAFRRRRSIIFVDGFYEWNQSKQPYYVQRKDSAPIALAGIFDEWGKGETAGHTCAIITTTPNEAIASIHNRMPVILPRDAWVTWIDLGNDDVDGLKSLLKPCPSDDLDIYPVSKAVNNPKNDSPELLRPLRP